MGFNYLSIPVNRLDLPNHHLLRSQSDLSILVIQVVQAFQYLQPILSILEVLEDLSGLWLRINL